MSTSSRLNTRSAPLTPSNREIFSMSWPMAMHAVMMFSIVIIDLYLVSSLGEQAVASIGVASVISGMILGTTFAFANAMQIKVAQAFGTEKPLELKTAFFSGMLINLCLALIGIALVALFGQPLLNMMAQSAQIADDAADYLNVFLLVLLAEALSSALTSHFNGCGRTKLGFYSFLISAPINVVSSIILIFGLYGFTQMGITGAAWGSFIGAALRFIYLSTMFYRSHGLFTETEGWLYKSFATATYKQFNFS